MYAVKDGRTCEILERVYLMSFLLVAGVGLGCGLGPDWVGLGLSCVLHSGSCNQTEGFDRQDTLGRL